MSYYLKKTNLKKGLYLQIYEGHHDPIKGYTVSKSIKKIGYLNHLIEQGIEDPISYFQLEVDKLNRNDKLNKLKNKNSKMIGERTPERNIGYFLLKNIMEDLGIKPYLDMFQKVRAFKFDLFETISALVYCRVIKPCSKSATFHDVIPLLFKDYNISYDQILECCTFIGEDYEKFVELFTAMTERVYGTNTNKTYFDCTNFYFEIDRADEFRRKGPSKENRNDPIVGLGLLLDANMIPIGMRVFPGNESERPILRNLITDMKQRNNIKGKTVQIADKGLNCANNIYKALKQKDGYIFSKSVLTLSEKEKQWVLLENDWVDISNSKGEITYSYKECIDTFSYSYFDENGDKVSFNVKEKRVLTYNPSLARKKREEILKMVEKAKNLCLSRAKRAEFGDVAKYISFKNKNGSSDEKDVIARVNNSSVEKDLKYCGYNLIVSSEVKMEAVEIYKVYHNLWRIEESFRVMKTDLDSRPVFVQRKDTIIGHFFICYIAVLLIRILQFKVLNNKYGTPEIIKFIKDFKAVKVGNRDYLNMCKKSDLIISLAKDLNLPLTNLMLTPSVIKCFNLTE